jgi:ribosomal protein S12 methylthiotransferase
MMGLLKSRGHSLTPVASEADAIVVNTCGFIGDAQQESVDALLEMARFKREGSAQRLIVTGCLVERFGSEIRGQVPEVDAILGTSDIRAIVAACEGKAIRRRAGHSYLYNHLTPRVQATPPHYAYIKIAEGCDHTCSFCVIPQFRGPFRSRQLRSVAAEATALFARGVREVNLVAQDTTSYGSDLGLRDGLPALLSRLARIETPHRKWIRFLYAYPNRITARLLDTLAEHQSLVKYIDMPLQHASSAILKRMRRGSGGDAFLRLIERIRRTVPGVTLRTSMIVGFPGESARDFQILCRFVEAARFDNLGVFGYSDEETSRSLRLDGKVSARDIYNRKRHLMAVQRRISKSLNHKRIGSEVKVLVEGPSQESPLLWQARTSGQAPEIDGVCLVNDLEGPAPVPGQFRRLHITEAHDYDLVGKLMAGGDAALPPVLRQAV